MEQTATNYDEYLTKRARNRKITMAVISAVVAFLAAAIIILSCVKINNRPQFVQNADVVEIFKPNDSNFKLRRAEGTAEYKQFYSAYDNCFKMSVLTSIFSNNFGGYSISELTDSKPVTYSGRATEIVEINQSDYYVMLSFNQPQSIKYKNGQYYRSGWSPDKLGDASANGISFKTVFFVLSAENEVKDLNMYVIVDGTLEKGQQNILTVTLKGNTYSLYDSLDLE